MSLKSKIFNSKNSDNVFVVFEAGPTHTGIESAKLLATHAKSAGANAIKFQITDHKKLIKDRSLLFSYDVINKEGLVSNVTEPLFDIWERRYMPQEDWRLLKQHCDNLNLDFFATIFHEDDIKLVQSLGVDSLKIASQDINYKDLIAMAARTGLPVQIDTGGGSMAEVEQAVDWILAEGNEKIIINHCPSGYPARLESIHLNTIKSLKLLYPHPIAFSDHNPGNTMDIAAVALGANIIEKTITLDKTQSSCEHMFSLEPSEMHGFVQTIRDVEIALGSTRRKISDEQKESSKSVRRSAYLRVDVNEGDILSKHHIEFKRPGHGIKPDQYQTMIGMKFKRQFNAGMALELEMFTG